MPCPSLTTAAECPALTVVNGKSSSDSASKTIEVVEVTCDDGYKKVGTGATTCSPDGPGKAKWTNVPSCEGRRCAKKGYPNSDREEGVTAEVGTTLEVKCHDSRETFLINCKASGPGMANWTGAVTCPGVFHNCRIWYLG